MYDNEAALTIRKNCTLIGEGFVPGRLFDLGTYPGMLFEPNASTQVIGEVYRIESNQKFLTDYLDHFEECGPHFEQPNEYRKEIIPVNINNSVYFASTYIYNRNVEGLNVILSGNYNDVTGTR